MTSSEIRNSFLKFFEERAHTIVPSAPVVPYDDPTLLFANAGMNQFKDVFLGTGKRSYTRAVDTQKCIRVSGKHNDLEEVGRDTYHHTFFEMLGNWSFGDYYKKEAIEWAWELLTKVWGLPKNRLWATVYKDDQEAEQLWKSVTDIDPNHILRFGEKDNFWEMGETGPCGPCSEIHIDRTPNGTAIASMVNAGVADVMEIWNLVFIQYNRDEAGKLTPLPAKHVDTGMGFERVCAVLQGKNSNYDTDVFTPIIEKITEVTGKRYNNTSPPNNRSIKADIDIAIRVIADHARMLTFAIADGATPSNKDRGYVLKRVLSRAVRFGRFLNMEKPFLYEITNSVIDAMGSTFPELTSKRSYINGIIKSEEERFNESQKNGLEYLYRIVIGEPIRQSLIREKKINSSWWVDDRLSDGNTLVISDPTNSLSPLVLNIKNELSRLKINRISGEDAFMLHDTYGIHIDTTTELAKEAGIGIDRIEFERLMEEQKERSRTGSANIIIPKVQLSATGTYTPIEKTTFLGYSKTKLNSIVVAHGARWFALRETPFYLESGGQVGDTGFIIADGVQYKVIDTKKDQDIYAHITKDDLPDIKNKIVTAEIDLERRLSIMRNHSATHLLHNALRRILGTHVQQAGSLVAPDYFRFDFSHFAKLSEQELNNIEALVNEKIKENIPRTPGLNNIPFEDARKMGALMFFGDKYGERVNVIQFGDFSTEFCGGTHVNNTGEIGYFKIRSEGSVASGVRRIEGVTGTYAVSYLIEQEQEFADEYNFAYNRFEEIFKSQIKDLKELPNIPNQASPELAGYFAQLHKYKIILKNVIEQDNETKKTMEKERAKSRLKSLSGSMDELISSAVSINNIKLIAARVPATSMDELKSLGDSLRVKLGSGVGLLASIIEDKVQLVCVVTDDLLATKKIEAGKIVGAVAKIVGGGGGGRPHMATAGGKDIAKIDEALSHTKSIVESLLKK
ncbi:MAG: alanine--tRNA ligase [Bacteroidota bacterium]